MASQLTGDIIMKNELFKAWTFLRAHKVCNIETLTTVTKGDVLAQLGTKVGKVLQSRISYFERGLDIMVVMVNPLTEEIETVDLNKNTKEKVWLELSIPYLEEGDVKLVKDVEMNLYGSGDTFEEAIISLAERVKSSQGDDITLSSFTLVD